MILSINKNSQAEDAAAMNFRRGAQCPRFTRLQRDTGYRVLSHSCDLIPCPPAGSTSGKTSKTDPREHTDITMFTCLLSQRFHPGGKNPAGREGLPWSGADTAFLTADEYSGSNSSFRGAAIADAADKK